MIMIHSPSRPSPAVSVVVPLYNEEANIGELHRRIKAVLDDLPGDYEVVFVNDGSRDATRRLADELSARDPQLVVLHLSRNFGHQAAVSAGIDQARGEAVVVMDGDLQDPPEVLPQFLQLWRDGHDVVYAVRRHRKEGWFKRLGYFLFYRLLGAISELSIPLDSGDFCLMDRKVVEALKALPEQRRFVRGLRTFVGFRQVGLEYERSSREAGRPKYTLRALLGLAIDGLVSFSSYPLRLVTYLGMATAFLALALTIWALSDAIYRHSAPQGWASIVIVVLFMGSVQLVCMGITGEYIRLIFLETKQRPTYIIESRQDRDGLAGHGPGGRDGRFEGSPGEYPVSGART
jgi:dolichol-phosphate mannosyltransferase